MKKVINYSIKTIEWEKIFRNLYIMVQVGNRTVLENTTNSAANNVGKHYFCGFTGVLCPMEQCMK